MYLKKNFRTNYFLSLPLLFFVTLFSQKIIAQTDSFFVATKNDSLFFSADFKQIEDRYKKFTEEIKGDCKKEYKEIYKKQFESIKCYFTEKKLLTNAKVQAYLNQLLKEIVDNNIELQAAPINIFFSKTEIPNAFYTGNNTIIFNSGLFHLLQNESQAAFVLCHELSHFYLKHIESKIEKYVTAVNSEEFQKELRKIKNAEFRQKEKLEKLALGLTFDTRKHSRFKESEADSMAVVFMAKTKFDNTEAINLLSLLDTLDKDNFNAEINLKTTFNSGDYPFKKSWLEKEEGLLGGHAKIKEDEEMADSLKTHPDCKKRIEIIKPILERYKQKYSQKSFVNVNLFTQLQTQLQLENISYYVEKKYGTTALYYCLKAIDKNPKNSNPFLITTIGSLFNDFYNSQKKHQLNRIAAMPSPEYNSSLNLVLQFIQNLDLNDYVNIGYNFLKKYQPQFQQYPVFVKALNDLKN